MISNLKDTPLDIQRGVIDFHGNYEGAVNFVVDSHGKSLPICIILVFLKMPIPDEMVRSGQTRPEKYFWTGRSEMCGVRRLTKTNSNDKIYMIPAEIYGRKTHFTSHREVGSKFPQHFQWLSRWTFNGFLPIHLF